MFVGVCVVCLSVAMGHSPNLRLLLYDSKGANVADANLNTCRTPTNFSVVRRLTSVWNACRTKWLLKKWEKSPTVLLCILDSSKFACRGGVCGWLPINTKLQTKPSTARLDPKTGRLLSVSISLLKSIESLILLL